MRCGRVSAFPLDGDINFVRRGHVKSAPESYMACLKGWMHMLGDDPVRLSNIKEAFVNHHRGSSWKFLFSRLKNQPDLSMDIGFELIEDDSSAQQAAGMYIMTAGMHHTFVLRNI